MEKNPYIKQTNEITTPISALPNQMFGTFNTKHFVIGALVGAVGAYLLTNEKAQKALFKTIAKGTGAFQAGIEEMKERFEDAKAELAVESE